MAKDWKDRLGMVYSTNPEFEYEYNEQEEDKTLTPEEQHLKVSLDRKHRKGKVVTLITGFIGKEEDLKSLAKTLKTKCGTGGSAKDGEIIIQGDMKQKITDYLHQMNYKTE